MFPIALDLAKIPILLIGHGELLARRRRQLEEYGATQLTVVEIPPPLEGGGKGVGLPPSLTLPLNGGGNSIVMVAGLRREQAEAVVAQAHTLGKLVNVEDINDLCDFYFTANIRRGDLVIAVSTSGASPTLARKIRDRIAAQFGEEWSARLSEIFSLRQAWKLQGVGMKDVVSRTEQHIEQNQWLVIPAEAKRNVGISGNTLDGSRSPRKAGMTETL